MARLETDDRRATDPHGFPPVAPETDPDTPRPRHDPWDPAHVPDPREPVFAEGRYADERYDDGQYDDGRYDDGRYADGRYADERYADARYADGRYDDGRYDTRYDDEAYPDAFHVEDPSTRHGGEAHARSSAVEHPVGRRARRRAAEARAEEEPRRGRRARPQRPPQDGTFVGHPDELEPDGGGLRFTTVAIPVAIGSLIAIGIGVWARTSDASGVAVNIAGFSSAGAVKTWLATLALVFALVQLWTAMAMRGGRQQAGRDEHRRVGSGPTPWTAAVHRWSGRIAVLVTVPVAVQCLIAMGWSGATPRTFVHSILGCVFYGAFVTKMLLLRRRGVPGWLIAVCGGLLLAVLAGIWLTSALWFFETKGLTF